MPEDKASTTELLIRLDERTSTIKSEIESLKDQIADLRRQFKEEKAEEREALKNYVTKDEFMPIQRGFYAMAGLIITTVIGTVLSIVLQKGP